MVLLDTGTPGTTREIYSEDADDGTRTRNPSVINRVLLLCTGLLCTVRLFISLFCLLSSSFLSFVSATRFVLSRGLAKGLIRRLITGFWLC